MLQQQAPAAPTAQRIEVIVARVREGDQVYTFGVLLGQVRTLLRRTTLTLRPNPQPQRHAPVAEALYEDGWLPVYDLAQYLGVLAPWKMGVHTGVRDYLLVVRGPQPLALAVDEVAEIGFCPLDQILPLPSWMRRQLRPPLVWGGLDRDALAYARSRLGDEVAPEVDRRAGDQALMLLLDCFAFQNAEGPSR
jgi:hypothetical protein